MEYCRNSDCRRMLPETWRVCPSCGTKQTRSMWRWAKLVAGQLQPAGEGGYAPIEIDRGPEARTSDAGQ